MLSAMALWYLLGHGDKVWKFLTKLSLKLVGQYCTTWAFIYVSMTQLLVPIAVPSLPCGCEPSIPTYSLFQKWHGNSEVKRRRRLSQ